MATELFDKFDLSTITPNASKSARQYIDTRGADSRLLDHCADLDAAKARLADAGTPDAEAAFRAAYQRVLQHPVKTPQGLQVKLAVMLLAHPELREDYPDVVDALSGDLASLA